MKIGIATIKQVLNKDESVLWKVRQILNGGPGSGNFGHAGIPGQVGGSAAGGGGVSQKTLEMHSHAFAKITDGSDIEYAMLIDGDGNAIGTFRGTSGSVEIPVGSIIKDSHFIHNHPDEDFPGLSPADVKVAINNDMASMTATGKEGIICIDRPQGGWDKNITNEVIDKAYRARLDDLRNQIAKHGKPISERALTKALSDASKYALGDIGVDFRYVKR